MRWGIGDVLLVFLVGVVVATVVSGVAAAVAGWDLQALADDEAVLLSGISAVAQFATFGLMLWLLTRLKGGGLDRDLGLTADRDVRAIALALLLGVGALIGLGLLVSPISNLADHDRQELVDQMDEASGVGLALLVVSAGVLAPVFEEILFRGLLLRSLLRRMPAAAAVLVSGTVFGVVHLIDPSALPSLPALVGVGMISGVLAVRSGGLARSIAFHMGFNLVTVVVTVAS